MYESWMTVAGLVLASGVWLAWEASQLRDRTAGPARNRALLGIGVVLALASLGLGVIGCLFLADPEIASPVAALAAFSAALALGFGAVAVFQAAGYLRRPRRLGDETGRG